MKRYSTTYSDGTARRLGIQERLVNGIGQTVAPLEVNGYVFPMHSTYLFERQKVYATEPSRGLTGKMVFAEKFFVPYFTVTYGLLSIAEYSAMMKILEADEVTVRYYDTWDNEYRYAKFYAQQPSMGSMGSRYETDGETVKYGYIQNTEIVFAGTNNDVDEITVEFFANADSYDGSVPTTISGWSGEEWEVPSAGTLSRNGYIFDCWSDSADGSGTKYAVGSIQVLTKSLILYAQWKQTTTFTLSLSYGFDDANIIVNNQTAYDAKILKSVNVTQNATVSGLPTAVDVAETQTDENNNKVVLKDTQNQPVYSFVGWNTLQSGNGTVYKNNETIYTVNGNSIAYAVFNIKSYTVTFYRDAAITSSNVWATISGEYGTQFTVNQPSMDGYTFAGWYTTDGGDGSEASFSATRIPAGNYTVYAKWEKN